ncbi:uncharacterized protein LOC124865591 isoform X2 [Girardinichthys multiradiatus]|uniref:uncharacterized protein LOC124865591 isoform X2 n=1 Tax=Girardinichthys multiradiatus TaxID=208333 RepID=UPI001FAE4CBB|nr:uncharacterized protein LOC124865591 isoform X2 [Girardinichthys multiradiatus]
MATTELHDLVQRLSATDSRAKDKFAVVEEQPLLNQRIAKMSSDINLLLETLEELSVHEFTVFKDIRSFSADMRPFSTNRRSWQKMEDLQEMVILIVQTCGEKSLMVTSDVLKNICRMDLAQRLLSRTSAAREIPMRRHPSALVHKVATMVAVRDVLLEILMDLSKTQFSELKVLLQFSYFQRGLQQISWFILTSADKTRIMDLMLNKFGRQSVEVTREILMDLRRTDLALMLPETSSTSKEELSMKLNSALLQKVEMLECMTELLLGTLVNLTEKELKNFQKITLSKIHHHRRYIPKGRIKIGNVLHIVVVIVLTYDQQSLKRTIDVLKEMKRNDLVKKLSDRSSGPKERSSADQQPSAWIHKLATMAVVEQLLLEVLNELSSEEFLSKFKRRLSDFLPTLKFTPERENVIDVMMEKLGQHSVKVIKKLLIEINRKDLAEILPEVGGFSVEEGNESFEPLTPRSLILHNLSEMLHKLNRKTVVKFKSFLQFTCFERSLPQIPKSRLNHVATAQNLVDLMMEQFGQQSVKIAREVLTDMSVTDLDPSCLETGLDPGKKSQGRVEFKYTKRVTDSDSWTKLEPEVKTTDPGEASTYSLQSEAGRFECSVSGFRWDCSEKVVFKYRFCSWDGHMERMESRGFVPAGPLMDINLITGKMLEVFLPHWICIYDIPKPLDQFAVLHMDDCGDAVENVSDVSSSHVKLTEPIFSPRAVLMRAGFPVKINCNMLIYRTNIAFLTLHVYLIPRDPALQQEMDRREKSFGYKVIRKPDPDTSLKMCDHFILTASLETAEVCPEKLKLRFDPKRPNFFEVYIKNPDTDFQLKLTPEKRPNQVWNCALRKEEYQITEERQAPGFSGGATSITSSHDVKDHVEEHLSPLMHKAVSLREIERETLLEVIRDLKKEELKSFKWFLKNTRFVGPQTDEDLLRITARHLENADAFDLVDLMLQTYSKQTVEVTKEVLRKINRNDLLEVLSGCSS